MSIIHLSTSQPLTRETIQQLHGDKDWPGQNRSAAISFRRRGFGEKEEVREHPLPDRRHKDRADRSRGQLAACVGEQSAAAAGRRHATRDWNDERAASRLLGTWGGTRVEEVVWAVVIWAHLTGRSAGEGNSSCCAIALLFILVLSNNSVLLLIYDSNQSNRQS
jgi:hypothetical protein